MSTSPSAWLGTSVCTPGYRTIGRRFTYWSSSNLDPQQQVALEDAGLHPRIADRPEQDRVELAEPLELLVGQRLAGAQVPVGAEVELDELDRGVAPHGLEHLEGLAHDLRAGAVALGSPRPGTQLVTGSPRSRLVDVRWMLHRAVDGREVGSRAGLDHVGRDASAGHPASVDVELDDDVA